MSLRKVRPSALRGGRGRRFRWWQELRNGRVRLKEDLCTRFLINRDVSEGGRMRSRPLLCMQNPLIFELEERTSERWLQL